MHLKRRNSWPPGVSSLCFEWIHVAETPSGKKHQFKHELYIKQIKYIMKYYLIPLQSLVVAIVLKDNFNWRIKHVSSNLKLQVLNFEIKCSFNKTNTSH